MNEVLNVLSGFNGLIGVIVVFVVVGIVAFKSFNLSDKAGRRLAHKKDYFDFDKITLRFFVPMGIVLFLGIIVFLPNQGESDIVYRVLGGIIVALGLPLTVWELTIYPMQMGFEQERRMKNRLRSW